MKQGFRNIFIHLSNVIDPSSAARIMKELSICAGGERLTIPTHKTLDIIERRQRIKRMYDKQHYSIPNLATIFCVSESTVKKDLQTEPFVIEEETQ